jgi:nicotinate-nucleotide pyrophosphorylase (carboxylating)
MESFLLEEQVRQALTEDLVYGDRTTEALFPRPIRAVGCVVAKEEMVVAGLDFFFGVFECLDSKAAIDVKIATGKRAKMGDVIAFVFGDGRALLKAERTALNFLQRLSGIATTTAAFVDAVAGTSVKIADTRKTTPGLRMAEKEAVLAGGGWNHRFHLGDMVLIKDNHIALAGGIPAAVAAVRLRLSHPYKIEVEAESDAEVHDALAAGCDLILLDNMTIAQIKKNVALIRKTSPSTLIEVSGGITRSNVAALAQCQVDVLSIGALTHSSPAVDISMEISDEDAP